MGPRRTRCLCSLALAVVLTACASASTTTTRPSVLDPTSRASTTPSLASTTEPSTVPTTTTASITTTTVPAASTSGPPQSIDDFLARWERDGKPTGAELSDLAPRTLQDGAIAWDGEALPIRESAFDPTAAPVMIEVVFNLDGTFRSVSVLTQKVVDPDEHLAGHGLATTSGWLQ